MDKLVLKDGTEIIDGKASRLNSQLMVTIPGNGLAEAAITFSNPEKTEIIEVFYGVNKKTFHGFTELYSVQYFAESDAVQVWLQGENVSEEHEYTVPEQYLPQSMRTKKENNENGTDDNTAAD